MFSFTVMRDLARRKCSAELYHRTHVPNAGSSKTENPETSTDDAAFLTGRTAVLSDQNCAPPLWHKLYHSAAPFWSFRRRRLRRRA